METMNHVGLQGKAQREFAKFTKQLDDVLQNVTNKAQTAIDAGKELPEMAKAFAENGMKKMKPLMVQMTNTPWKKAGLITAGVALVGGVTALILRKK